MVEPVLDTAGRFADASIYERLEAAMIGARDRRERADLQRSIARVREARLRDRALALTLDDRLDGRDALHLLEQVLEDDANRAAAFDFVRGHFDALVAKLPPETPGQLVTPLGELCTRSERDAFAAFFRERSPRFLGGPKRYAEALESIDQCIEARGETAISLAAAARSLPPPPRMEAAVGRARR
jgi:alanyl aminopeptidase